MRRILDRVGDLLLGAAGRASQLDNWAETAPCPTRKVAVVEPPAARIRAPFSVIPGGRVDERSISRDAEKPRPNSRGGNASNGSFGGNKRAS